MLMFFRVFIIMSLTVLLSSSSFFLEKKLTEKITQGTISKQEFTFALARNFVSAHAYQLNNAVVGDEHWLKSAKFLAIKQGKFAYVLAEYYHKKQQLSLAIKWYKHAIKLNYLPANVTLASYYFANDQITLASHTLAHAIQDDEAVINLQMQIAISLGDLNQITQLYPYLSQSKEGKLLLDNMQHYQVLSPKPETRGIPSACSLSLQFFATTLADLTQLSILKQKFTQHPLNKTICLATPRYLSSEQVSCLYDEKKAIRCDETMWQPLSNTIDTRYIGIMLPKGGANVHYGILYLDREDDVEVFAHEVSHLLGFIDEYALPVTHQKCLAVQQQPFSHNISVLAKEYLGERELLRKKVLAQVPWAKYIKDSTPIFTKKGNLWILATPEKFAPQVGMYPAETCERERFSAFKPLKERTQLRYFQYPFPLLYQALINDDEGKFSMPSFHYNIAYALYKQKKLAQATLWLEQAAKREGNQAKKIKILQGNF